MADKDKKLIDREAVAEDGGANNTSAIEPKLIKRESKTVKDTDDRLETLYYKERYRQKVRRSRTAHTDDTEERLLALRKSQATEAREAMERELGEAKAHTDRITELLSRINAMGMESQEPREVIDMALGKEEQAAADNGVSVSDFTEEDISSDKTESDGENVTAEEEPKSFITRAKHQELNTESGVIDIKSGIKREILRIDATKYPIGEEPNRDSISYDGNFVSIRRKQSSATGENAQTVKGNSSEYRYGFYSAGSVGYPEPERRLYSDPERGGYPDAERRLYSDPERGTYPDAERRLYSDPERGAYPDAERRLYSDPERGAYPDAERRLYSDPERGTYPDAERRLYSDPERGTYPDAERRLYSDPERGTYPDAERRLYSDPERGTYPDAERRLYSDPERGTYPDPEASVYSDENIGNGGASFAYPEADTRFITRKTSVGKAPLYIPSDTYSTSQGVDGYPDPESREHREPESTLDPTYPDPVRENTGEERPLSAKERKRLKREEKRAMLEDALRFEAQSKEGSFIGTAVPDPEHNGYGEAEMNEYPDPEAPVYENGDNLSMIDDPNSLYAEAKNTADELLMPRVKPRAMKKFIRRAVALDVKRIKERYAYKLKELKLELRGKELRFTFKRDKEERSAREVRADMHGLAALERRDIHRARVVGRVCTAVMLTDFTTAKLKRHATRATLIELRSKLLHMLTERYYFDESMIAVYKGNGGREDADGRLSAKMRGIKRAYKIQNRARREVEQNRVSPAYKKKIYDLMNEFVELSGEYERVLYSLKRERPRGAVKRELKRQRRKLRRKLARISDHIDYYKKRGIERAKDRREVRRNAILGWVVLLVLVAAGVLVYMNWSSILGYITSLLGGASGGG